MRTSKPKHSASFNDAGKTREWTRFYCGWHRLGALEVLIEHYKAEHDPNRRTMEDIKK